MAIGYNWAEGSYANTSWVTTAWLTAAIIFSGAVERTQIIYQSIRNHIVGYLDRTEKVQ